MAITSAARLATGHAIALARSLSWKDRAVEEEAWWEPGQGAMCIAVSREGLPRTKAAAQSQRAAQEGELEDTWGML
jgi:hypothetical protein